MSIRDGVFEFVYVAETESFTAAAKRMDVSVAHISRHVNQLENRLGAKLLYRTTRQIRLTEVGEVYYHYARKVMDELQEAERAVIEMEGKQIGKLRMTAPVYYGEYFVAPLVNDFLLRYPKIDLELNLTNRVIRVSIGAASNILGGQRAGVELSLYDASDNLIRTWTTTNAPITFTDLEAGSYYVTMGENSEKHYTFQVVDQAAIQTVSVGASKTALYALIGGGVVVLLGIVITGVSALRKRKKKDRS